MTFIETSRLLLRQWQQSDFAHFAELNADQLVMEYFPSVLTSRQSDALAIRLSNFIAENDWGYWAAEEKSSGKFIGFVGLYPAADELPFSPSTEIGWRLAPPYWGKGFASEAANASLEYAFEQLSLSEVVSITTTTNLKSQKVMQNIGMQNTQQNFRHPALSLKSPLSEHVLYKVGAAQWQLCYDARN
jgi:RimJ/RimL family protein N-acetyltransferase